VGPTQWSVLGGRTESGVEGDSHSSGRPEVCGGNRQIEHHGISGYEVRRPLEAFQCSAKRLQVARKAYIAVCIPYSMMIPEQEMVFGGRVVL